MIIYQDTKAGYLRDVTKGTLKDLLCDAFRAKTGSVPADQDVWADEYANFAGILERTRTSQDIQVAIEYHISAVGRFRVDVLLAGSDGAADNAMIVELKAWETAGLCDIPEMVKAPLAGGSIVQHPCVQARKYKGIIQRFNHDVRERDIRLHSLAYLFNLHRRSPEPLEDPRYEHTLKDTRLFLANDGPDLRNYIEQIVPHKSEMDVVLLIENGRLRPADGLIERVSSMLEGNPEFELYDEQNVAYQSIRHDVLSNTTDKKRHVYVVEGGPGTGKSVLAIRLLSDILHAKRMVYFVAPNKAFRDTLIESLARGNNGYREDGQALLRSSWSFSTADHSKGSQIDVLVVDEAHRLKDKAYQYDGEGMAKDMVRAARVSIFFIDETQRVSWNDTGSVDSIKQAAAEFHAQFHGPFPLTAQYRCNGSTGYLNWLDDVLQIRPTANYDNWGNAQYEFKVFDSPKDLYASLKANNSSNKARLVAGYSWVWPKQGRQRGTTAKHVTVDGLSLPWNYEGENWATSPDGINQVGCIHTSQGVEFDWLGVLIGPDLTYRAGRVVGDPAKRAKTDASLNGWKTEFARAAGNAKAQAEIQAKVQNIIKSTYKVLLTRGCRGCYVWCADVPLREYLKQRLALASAGPAKARFS